MVVVAAELTWLRYLLHDLGLSQSSPRVLYCDNLSALYLTVNPMFHATTKHVEIDYHYEREQVALQRLETHYVLTSDQLADIFTKPLLVQPFTLILSKLVIIRMSRLREGI